MLIKLLMNHQIAIYERLTSMLGLAFKKVFLQYLDMMYRV